MKTSFLFIINIASKGSILFNRFVFEMFKPPLIYKFVSIFSFCITTHLVYCQNLNDDNLYLFTKLSNEAAVYSLDEISKITFSKKGIQIWNTNWPTEYAYTNLSVLTFIDRESLLQTKVESPDKKNTDNGITYNTSSFTMSVACGQMLKGVVLYNSIGVIVFSDMDSKYNYHIQLSGLPEGVYIIKVFGEGRTESKKFVK